jgi:acetyl esterase/lipase
VRTAPPGGPRDGQAPYGVILGIHGGGWVEAGLGQLTIHRSAVEPGTRVARRRSTSITDHARVRFGRAAALRPCPRTVGPTTPICVTGQSASGHLALLLAADRTDIACEESLAVMTDLKALGAQEAVRASGSAPRARPRGLAAAAAGAFGSGEDAVRRGPRRGDHRSHAPR